MSTQTFAQLIDVLRPVIRLQETDDGSFALLCDCGAEWSPRGGILLRGDRWVVMCESCLKKEPKDDLRIFDPSEVVCLTLTASGKRVTKKTGDTGWSIWWRDKEKP